MAAYSYKEVANREDFRAARDEWEKQTGNECDGDPGYDGDYWYVAAFLLDKKDAEIAALKAQLAPAPTEGR